MYIENYLNPKSTRSLRYAEQTPGLVVKSNAETGKDNVLGVYIPRLMFGLSPSKGAYENTIAFGTSKLLNSKNKSIGGNSLTIRNYVELSIATIPNINTPQFVCGENVMIDFADSDIKSAYILPYSFGDLNRRTTDDVTFMVPNFKKPGETPSISNTYGFQLNSRDQIISIWCSKNNGEKSDYAIIINAAEGKVLVSDSGKRAITIDTEKDNIQIKNEGGSSIDLTKDVIDMVCGTLNIKAKNDINITSTNMKRKVDNISTESTKDEEKIDQLSLKGNTYKREYNKQTVEGSSYEHKTSKWACTSPISGFSGKLTSASYTISSAAGTMPPPTNMTITEAGVGLFGSPNTPSIPVAKALPVISSLLAIAGVVDSLCSIECIPPTLSGVISGITAMMSSSNITG